MIVPKASPPRHAFRSVTLRIRRICPPARSTVRKEIINLACGGRPGIALGILVPHPHGSKGRTDAASASTRQIDVSVAALFKEVALRNL